MIRSWLYNLHKKYDSVKEPDRIFLLMGIALPGIIMTTAENNYIAFGGAAYLLILLAIRALYIHGKLK